MEKSEAYTVCLISVVVPVLMAVGGEAMATPPPGYTLVYQDNFDGTALNTGDWGYRENRNADIGNVSVSGGSLHINLKRISTSTGVDGYRGGGIISKRAFGYGYYETSARLINDNGGWHPAAWTHIWDGQFAEPAYNATFTEVDVFEGWSGTSADAGYHSWTSNLAGDQHDYQSNRTSFSGDKYSAYHTYGVDYTPTRITFYYDGVAKGYIDYSTTPSGLPPSNSPMSMWLTAIPYNASLLDSSQPVGHSYGSIDFDYFRYYTPTGTIQATVPATRAASVTTYSETFESGTATGWTTNGVGSWSVVTDGDQVYKNSATVGDAISYYSNPTVNSSTWVDSSLEAGIKFYNAALGGCGIVGRYQDANNYYYLQLNAGTGQVILLKKVGGTVTNLATATMAITTGVTYNLKLAMKDEQLTGYVNGTALVAATDTSFVVGKVGVKSYNQSFSANHFYINPL